MKEKGFCRTLVAPPNDDVAGYSDAKFKMVGWPDSSVVKTI